MPQLQSIVEVVEVSEPLKEAVSVRSAGRWRRNLREHLDVRRGAQRMSTSGCGYRRVGPR